MTPAHKALLTRLLLQAAVDGDRAFLAALKRVAQGDPATVQAFQAAAGRDKPPAPVGRSPPAGA